MFDGVVEEFAGDANVLDTILTDLFFFTFFPPLARFESVARLSFFQSRFGESLETDTSTEHFLYFSE